MGNNNSSGEDGDKGVVYVSHPLTPTSNPTLSSPQISIQTASPRLPSSPALSFLQQEETAIIADFAKYEPQLPKVKPHSPESTLSPFFLTAPAKPDALSGAKYELLKKKEQELLEAEYLEDKHQFYEERKIRKDSLLSKIYFPKSDISELQQKIDVRLQDAKNKIIFLDSRGFVQIWDLLSSHFCKVKASDIVKGAVSFSLIVAHKKRIYAATSISISHGYDIFVFNLEKNAVEHVLKGHDGNITSMQVLKLTKNYYYLISGSDDCTIKIWDVQHGTCLHTMRRHHGAITNLQVFGEKLVSGSKDKTVRVWSLESRSWDHCLIHYTDIRCMVYDDKGRVMSGGSYFFYDNKEYKIWFWKPQPSGSFGEIEYNETVVTAHNSNIIDLKLYLSGFLISAGIRENIKIWDIDTCTCLDVIPVAPLSRVHIFNDILIVHTSSIGIEFWSLITKQQIRTITFKFVINDIQCTDRFLCVYGQRCIEVWNIESFKQERLIDIPGVQVNAQVLGNCRKVTDMRRTVRKQLSEMRHSIRFADVKIETENEEQTLVMHTVAQTDAPNILYDVPLSPARFLSTLDQSNSYFTRQEENYSYFMKLNRGETALSPLYTYRKHIEVVEGEQKRNDSYQQLKKKYNFSDSDEDD